MRSYKLTLKSPLTQATLFEIDSDKEPYQITAQITYNAFALCADMSIIEIYNIKAPSLQELFNSRIILEAGQNRSQITDLQELENEKIKRDIILDAYVYDIYYDYTQMPFSKLVIKVTPWFAVYNLVKPNKNNKLELYRKELKRGESLIEFVNKIYRNFFNNKTIANGTMLSRVPKFYDSNDSSEEAKRYFNSVKEERKRRGVLGVKFNPKDDYSAKYNTIKSEVPTTINNTSNADPVFVYDPSIGGGQNILFALDQFIRQITHPSTGISPYPLRLTSTLTGIIVGIDYDSIGNEDLNKAKSYVNTSGNTNRSQYVTGNVVGGEPYPIERMNTTLHRHWDTAYLLMPNLYLKPPTYIEPNLVQFHTFLLPHVEVGTMLRAGVSKDVDSYNNYKIDASGAKVKQYKYYTTNFGKTILNNQDAIPTQLYTNNSGIRTFDLNDSTAGNGLFIVRSITHNINFYETNVMSFSTIITAFQMSSAKSNKYAK